LAPARGRFGWREPQCLFQPVDGGEHAPLEFDQGSAGLAEAAIVFRPPPEAGALAGRERPQSGFAVLGPGEHGGKVQWSSVGSAVAGWLAAAGVEFVDRAFDELSQGEQFIELLLGVGQQGLEGEAQAAGAIRAYGQ